MSRRDGLGVAVLVAVTSTYLSLLGLQQVWTVRATVYDLVIYDQGIRSYSRFEAPAAISMGVRSGLGPDFTLLGDHFSPVLALLAPLYWIHDGPVTLIVAQGVLLAVAAVPLWVIVRRELSTPAAYLVAAAYSISWPLVKAAGFDFHEVAFAPLLTAVLLERYSAWRRGSGHVWQIAAAGVALACVKEDMGLLLAGFGLALLVSAIRSGRRVALLGVGFLVGGLVWTAVMTAVVIPAFGGRLGADWRYDQFGSTPGQALATMAGDPVATAGELVTPSVKVATLLMLLVISAGACLLSPYVVTVVPLLAARLLSDNPAWWSAEYHYNAFLVVPLLVAGVDGIARTARWVAPGRPRVVTTTWGVGVVLVALAALPNWGDTTVLTPGGWARDAHARAGLAAAAEVPHGALVEVPNGLGPQLTARTTVLLLDHTRHDAPWVIVDTARRQFPFCSLGEQAQRVADLRRDGYDVTGEFGGYVVLHDQTARPQLDAPAVPSPCR